MTVFTHYPQERVYFGDPLVEALDAEVQRLGAERVFIMGSASLESTTDWRRQVEAALGNRFAGWQSGMPPHTPREAVLDMTRAARSAGADVVVTLGGGSLTDAGKMVRLALEHDIDAVEGFDAYRTRVAQDGAVTRPSFDGPRVAQITIPTTLSGGEFNVSAGCTDVRANAKQLYRHPALVPVAVILDPAVTVHTPEWLWLSTGMRAVDHCVETLCSLLGNRQADGAALNGLKLLVENLPAARADSGDLEARLNCQIGAWQAMEHNQSGVPMGASHGIGHVLGGTCGVPHGHTSCVMLPAALRWNVSANADRQALVAAAMGGAGEAAGDVVERFVRGLGQPARLGEVGVGPERFDEIAAHAMHDRYIHTNPRPITGPDEVKAILALAA